MNCLISKKFYEYLFAMLMITIALSLSFVINAVIAGKLLGPLALASINLNNPIINLISAIINVFSFGTSTTIAYFKGRLEDENSNKSYTIAILFGFLTVFLIMFFCLLNLDNIAGILCNYKSPELMKYTKDYLFPLVLNFPVLFFFLLFIAFIRVEGFPKYSAFLLIFSSTINIICSYIFIKYLNLGIAGSSYGMLSGFIIGSILVTFYFLFPDKKLKLRKISFNDIKNFFPTVFKTGLPNGAVNVFVMLRVFVLNIFILSIFNATGVAIFAMCTNIVYFAYIFVRGSANTLLLIVGMLFGEEDFKNIEKVLITGFTITFFASLLFVGCFLFAPDLIANMYGLKLPEELALAKYALKSFAFCIPFFGFNYIYMCYFQCTKRSNFALFISAANNFLLVVFFVFLLSKINNHMLWWGFPIAEVAMLVLILAYCYHLSKKENATFPFLLPKEILEISHYIDIKNNEKYSDTTRQNLELFLEKNSVSAIYIKKINSIVNELFNIERKNESLAQIMIQTKKDSIAIKYKDNDKNNTKENYKISTPSKNIDYAKNIGFNVLIIKL